MDGTGGGKCISNFSNAKTGFSTSKMQRSLELQEELHIPI
ncbi:UNVERIFIED_CONTAM: hypothetical protein BJ099_12551 [Lysinibacillus xylanilyticus]